MAEEEDVEGGRDAGDLVGGDGLKEGWDTTFSRCGCVLDGEDELDFPIPLRPTRT